MKYRRFGETKLCVSEIGYGTWPLAGDANGTVSYGKVSESDAQIALLTAFDVGINVYDTSDFYGFGYVESLLGKTFPSPLRNHIVYISKCGLQKDGKTVDISPANIVKSIEGSLKRLGTDYIDVYMLHSPTIADEYLDSAIDTLHRLKKEGKVTCIGVSLKSPNDGSFIIRGYDIDAVEINYNILDHRAEDIGVFKMCKAENIAVVCRTPLSQGIITGEFQYNQDAADLRNSTPKERFFKLNAAYSEMLYLTNKENENKAKLALEYCLSNDAISCVIPGMKNESEVLMNYKVDSSALKATDINVINETYKRHGL